MDKTKKQLITYVAVTVAMTWAYEFGLVWPAAKGGLNGSPTAMAQVLVMGAMFFPALGMLLTRLIMREGFGDMLLRPRFKGHGREYLLAYFGPAALAILGSALYFLVFPGKLDLSCGYMRSVMEAAGNPYEAQALPIKAIVAVQIAQALLLSGAVNLLPSLGEEWGWRGYMMPRLLKITTPGKALLLGGLIWGLWHAPLTAVGHNYGLYYPGFPWLGIAAMCVSGGPPHLADGAHGQRHPRRGGPRRRQRRCVDRAAFYRRRRGSVHRPGVYRHCRRPAPAGAGGDRRPTDHKEKNRGQMIGSFTKNGRNPRGSPVFVFPSRTNHGILSPSKQTGGCLNAHLCPQ